MKKILFAICLVIGCYSVPARDVDRADVINLNHCVTYYKDMTTGVCLLGCNIANPNAVLTSVSCTSEVEHAAHKFNSGSSK